jgi:hypothetical protein
MRVVQPRPVATPDRIEKKRTEAHERWAEWQREREMQERLDLHRALAFGERPS